MNYELPLPRIVSSLHQLANEAYQRRDWHARSGPNISFGGAVSELFDDTGLGDMLSSNARAPVFTRELDEGLRRLERLVAHAANWFRSLDPAAIIDHPRMREIRALASDALTRLQQAVKDDTRQRLYLARRGVETAYEFYLREACPCAFPRFLQLVGFRHEDYGAGPVACIEQSHMIGFATSEAPDQRLPAVFKPAGPWERVDGSNKRLFVCRVCRTESLLIGTEFNVNVSRVFMVFGDVLAKTVGLSPEPQIPLVACLHGFNQADFEKCTGFFRQSHEADMVRYLTARSAAPTITH